MEVMSQYPDGHFDLAIVDPPYGISEDGKKITHDANSQGRLDTVQRTGIAPFQTEPIFWNFDAFLKIKSSGEVTISIFRHRRVGLFGIRTTQVILRIVSLPGPLFHLQ